MYLARFFAAWGVDWTGRMSGLASIGLTFWAAFFPPTISGARYALLATAAVCFILGSYHIWAREHKAFVEEQGKSQLPNIIGEIEEIFIDVGRTQTRKLLSTFFTLRLNWVNTVDTLAMIKEYKLTVAIDGVAHETRISPVRHLRLWRPASDADGFPLPNSEAEGLDNDLDAFKMMRIEKGEYVRGWLRFILVGKHVDTQKGCKPTLHVIDAYGRDHPITNVLTWKRSGEIMTIIEKERGSP